MGIDREVVERKLRRIEEFLRELREIKNIGFSDYRRDVVVKRFIERNLELSVEQMVDVCRHIASRLFREVPESYSHCFELLAGRGVIPVEHLEIYKKMVKFRNLLIHLYEGVDDSIVYGIYKNHLKDFELFISDIREFLKTLPN